LSELEHHGPRLDSARIGLAYSIARRQVEAILRSQACLADREEVVALAIERVWTNRGRLRVDERFPGWVARIARNASFDWLRARRTAGPLDEPTTWTDPTTPERELACAELRRALLLALAELPEAQREVWLLKEIEGLSYGEIALVRGISSNTVGPTLAAARVRLVRELCRLGLTP
jgi:RNA polymerase sigma-70 factor (ECF subfamily)